METEPGTVGTTVLSGTGDGILGGGDCTMPGINSQITTAASGKGPTRGQYSASTNQRPVLTSDGEI